MKNKPKLENKEPKKKREYFSRLEQEYLYWDKFTQVCQLFYAQTSTLVGKETKIKTTRYSKISIKKLLSYFEDENFINFSDNKIAHLCSEVNYRISKQLSGVPCKIEMQTFNQTILGSPFMEYNKLSNSITIYVDYMKSYHKDMPKILGLQILFSLLHETYHSCQNSNFKRFVSDQPYNQSMINDYLLSLVTLVDELYITDPSKEFCFKMNKNLKTKDYEQKWYISRQLMNYVVNFEEFEANSFALNFLKRYNEKGYFTNDKNVKYVYAVRCTGFVGQFFMLNRIKRNFEMTRKELLYISKKADEKGNRIVNYVKPKIVKLLQNFDTEKEFAERKDKLLELMSETSKNGFKVYEEFYENSK